MNHDSFERPSFEAPEQCAALPDNQSFHLAQVRGFLRAAALGTRKAGTSWPVFVQDRKGTTLLYGELPLLLAVQRLREDLADLGYRQVVGATEGTYVFRPGGTG